MGTLVLAFAGLAIPVCAQETGPLPPAPSNPPATQSTPQNAPPKTNDANPPAQSPAPAAAAPADASTPAATAAPAPGTTPAPAVTPAPATAPVAPTPSARIQVPAGTHIPLVLHNAISTRSARPGDPVYLETLFPIMIDGHVVIPAGSYMSGEITETKRPGRVKGKGELMVKLSTLILPNAYMVNLNATPGGGAGSGGNETMDSEGKVIGDSDKLGDAATIARTTIAGAGIGGLATRTPAGAGIGAGIGAAAGLMAVLLTRGPDAVLPRGSTLEAVLDRPLYLEADKVQFTGPGQASTLAGPPNREPQRSRIPF
jgi:hypothetical protein